MFASDFLWLNCCVRCQLPSLLFPVKRSKHVFAYRMQSTHTPMATKNQFRKIIKRPIAQILVFKFLKGLRMQLHVHLGNNLVVVFCTFNITAFLVISFASFRRLSDTYTCSALVHARMPCAEYAESARFAFAHSDVCLKRQSRSRIACSASNSQPFSVHCPSHGRDELNALCVWFNKTLVLFWAESRHCWCWCCSNNERKLNP